MSTLHLPTQNPIPSGSGAIIDRHRLPLTVELPDGGNVDVSMWEDDTVAALKAAALSKRGG